MRAGQERVSRRGCAAGQFSLRNAPKARGRWGEQQLKNVLESCGLTEHVDFVTEASVDTAEEAGCGQMPSHTYPATANLVIDAKVSLNDYQDAFNAADEETARSCDGATLRLDEEPYRWVVAQSLLGSIRRSAGLCDYVCAGRTFSRSCAGA